MFVSNFKQKAIFIVNFFSSSDLTLDSEAKLALQHCYIFTVKEPKPVYWRHNIYCIASTQDFTYIVYILNTQHIFFRGTQTVTYIIYDYEFLRKLNIILDTKLYSRNVWQECVTAKKEDDRNDQSVCRAVLAPDSRTWF